MRRESETGKAPAEQVIKDIKRRTRRAHGPEEKIRIVLEGLRGEDSIAELCRREGINQNLYYRWSKEFLDAGKKRLAGDSAREATSGEVRNLRQEPDLSSRELAVKFTDTQKYFVSEASVYRLLKAHGLVTSPAFIVIKAADEFHDKTTAPNQLWQTDFTYLKVLRWGWFYLATVLDDFSRYIVVWKLCATMASSDVTDTLKLALHRAGLEQAPPDDRPRLLTDNGPCYLSSELAGWLGGRDMAHTRGAPYHPQTQGKIERWHQTLKNRILLENYYLPGDLEAQIEAFVEHYNHQRYHESLGNLTPADVYFGRGDTIILERERIKRQTIQNRRLQHAANAA